MIGPRWKKVLSDLWGNRVRSILVIASIFIGVLGVGITVSLYVLIDQDLKQSWLSINPFQARLYTDTFDTDFLESVKRVPGVSQAEGSSSVSAQLRIGPDKWIPLSLTAIPDFKDQKIDLLTHDQGTFPPLDRQILIERGSYALTNAKIGAEMEIKLTDGTIRKMPLVGIVHDGTSDQGTILGLYGFITADTLEWLHEPDSLNILNIVISKPNPTKDEVQLVADAVGEQVKKSGRSVYYTLVYEPGKHPAASQVLGVISVLGILGVFTMALGGFLIYNTLSALLTQHIRYIGVMKAIGAKSSQIIGMYIVLIMAFSALALLPAIPLAANFAYGISAAMAKQFNYNSLGFRIIPQAIITQIIIGLVIPLITGIIPVLIGARITVREAISNYGLGQGQLKRGIIDRLTENVRGFSRPVLISIRNTFRRKGRLFLTLLTLTLGGAIFISVFNLRISLMSYIDQISKYFLSDVNLQLNQNYPIEKVTQDAKVIPEVIRVEGWAFAVGNLLGASKKGEENIQILAPPADSSLIEPIMIKGRWILPDDENAMVVNNAFWRVRPDLNVGDIIHVRINDQDTSWTIVGFYQFPGDTQLLAYANYNYLSRLINAPNRAVLYRIVANDHSPAAQEKLARLIENRFKSLGYQLSSVQTGSSIVQANASAMNTIVSFFLVMAIMIALVGAIGLMGTMSMNVIERTREIGVMRAIGATDKAVLNIVLVEGLLIGFLSWLFGTLIAIPISKLLFDVMMQALFRSPGKFVMSPEGFSLWFVLAMTLSVLASILPARNASRLTIREVLAYE